MSQKKKYLRIKVQDLLDAIKKDRTPKAQLSMGWYPDCGFIFDNKATCAIGGAARSFGVSPWDLHAAVPFDIADFIMNKNDETRSSKRRIATMVEEQFPDLLDRNIVVGLPVVRS